MAAKTVAAKKRTKIWYPIYAPSFMNELFLGESHVYGKTELEGKTLKLNLFAITNDIKKQNLDIAFKVIGVVENKAQTRVMGAYLTQSYIKRLVRRGRDKVDDSFLVKTSDRKLLRVKPLMVTNNKANKSVISRIRMACRDLVARSAIAKSHEEFFNDVMSNKLQKELRDKLSKLYPLRFLEIRQVVVLKDDVSIDEPLPEEPKLDTESVEDSEKEDEQAAEPQVAENPGDEQEPEQIVSDEPLEEETNS